MSEITSFRDDKCKIGEESRSFTFLLYQEETNDTCVLQTHIIYVINQNTSFIPVSLDNLTHFIAYAHEYK